MGLFDTTANEVAVEMLGNAKKGIIELRDFLEKMEESLNRCIERNKKSKAGEAFAIHWCTMVVDRAVVILNEVARCNGAVLVRGKKNK